jgi:hypothetical protein
MDQEIQELLRQLRDQAPDLARSIENLVGSGISWSDLRTILLGLLAAARRRKLLPLVIRILLALARTGQLPVAVEALVAEAAVGEAGAVGVASTPFLPLSLGGWLVVFTAVAVIAFSGYRIYRQLTTDAATLPSGPQCDLSTATGRQLATVPRGPIEAGGTFSSQIELFNEAMNSALKVCTGAGTCSGGCSTGTCVPNVSLQEFDIKSYFVYRKVILKKFYCPCECLLIDPKTGEMKGGSK